MAKKSKPTAKEIAEEQRKLNKLRFVVDFAASMLRSGQLSTLEKLQLTRATRAFVLKLFPGKEETYNLIYKPRFDRIINEELNQN
ncbi:MAG: hypothetical protein GXO75_17760 [Calditrichaeota bacterium]|nr:hypothetical protein [Calditrichota bacterium]